MDGRHKTQDSLKCQARVNHITQEAVLKDIMERVYKPSVRRRSSAKSSMRFGSV